MLMNLSFGTWSCPNVAESVFGSEFSDALQLLQCSKLPSSTPKWGECLRVARIQHWPLCGIISSACVAAFAPVHWYFIAVHSSILVGAGHVNCCCREQACSCTDGWSLRIHWNIERVPPAMFPAMHRCLVWRGSVKFVRGVTSKPVPTLL